MNPEPLEHVIKKKQSFPHLWALLEPDEAEFGNLKSICRRRWENNYTYRQQQQIYWFLREKKRKKETIYNNPLYAITYCNPKPYDWNGDPRIDEQFRREKMVSAFYKGKPGLYPKNVADYFEMTHIEPRNF